MSEIWNAWQMERTKWHYRWFWHFYLESSTFINLIKYKKMNQEYPIYTKSFRPFSGLKTWNPLVTKTLAKKFDFWGLKKFFYTNKRLVNIIYGILMIQSHLLDKLLNIVIPNKKCHNHFFCQFWLSICHAFQISRHTDIRIPRPCNRI